MKTVELLTGIPLIASLAGGASVISEMKSASAIAANGLDGDSYIYPIVGLGVIAALLISGLFMISREMRREMNDHSERYGA